MTNTPLLIMVVIWAATFMLVAATALVGFRLALWILFGWEIPGGEEDGQI